MRNFISGNRHHTPRTPYTEATSRAANNMLAQGVQRPRELIGARRKVGYMIMCLLGCSTLGANAHGATQPPAEDGDTMHTYHTTTRTVDQVPVEIRHYPSIDSTQNQARAHPEWTPREGVLALRADEQTNGIGQHTRTWASPKAGDIYVTFMLPWPEKEARKLTQVSLVSALSVAETLETYGLTPRLKWVNDILVGGHKIGGVLSHSLHQDDAYAVFVGIGLNVNRDRDALTAGKISQPATSMAVAGGQTCDTEAVFDKLTERLVHNLHTLRDHAFSHTLLPRVQERAAYLNEAVDLEVPGREARIRGRVEGFDENGFLRFREAATDEVSVYMSGRIFPAGSSAT